MEIGNMLASSFSGLADQFGRLRYGVPTSQKEVQALSGTLPGAPTPTEDAEEAQRYASGYLFQEANPTIAPTIQDIVNLIKVSDLPFFGGSSPELQSYAVHGANMARLR